MIIKKILYKKAPNDSSILCVPELLGKQVIFDCHNRIGFHFKTHQLCALLKPLIYHPDLDNMINKIVKTCLLCKITAPKRIRTLIGSQRSNFYAPLQCLVIDNAYLPKSQQGFSKALILVDACTGYTIVYPSRDLLAATVKKHLLTDFGSEFKENNIKSTSNILANFKKFSLKRLVHVSSSVVESAADDYYTQTKKQQELIVQSSGII